MVTTENPTNLLEKVEEDRNEVQCAPQTWGKQGTSVAVGEYEAIVLAHS